MVVGSGPHSITDTVSTTEPHHDDSAWLLNAQENGLEYGYHEFRSLNVPRLLWHQSVLM